MPESQEAERNQNITEVMINVRKDLETYALEISKLLDVTDDIQFVTKFLGTIPGLSTTFRHLGEGVGKKIEKSVVKAMKEEVTTNPIPAKEVVETETQE